MDIYKKQIKEHLLELEKHKARNFTNLESERLSLSRTDHLRSLALNFYIWGHSLDVSDKDYILDLFSLNDEIDRNVRVTIYYFDQNAKFALLNNLLAILEKDKVEQWMKNKWLQFKSNPKIKFGEIISEKTA